MALRAGGAVAIGGPGAAERANRGGHEQQHFREVIEKMRSGCGNEGRLFKMIGDSVKSREIAKRLTYLQTSHIITAKSEDLLMVNDEMSSMKALRRDIEANITDERISILKHPFC
jgi:hypothetical protein